MKIFRTEVSAEMDSIQMPIEMDEPELNVICPEDCIRVMLPAKMIPDRSKVTKRGGEMFLTLLHKITVYTASEKQEDRQPPMVIYGYFLDNGSGNFTQIKPDTILCWVVTAEKLVDDLTRSWERDRN